MQMRPSLFTRDPREWDSAREVARARAHRLLDAVRAGMSDASTHEISRALWATGDMVPVDTAAARGLADLHQGSGVGFML